MRRHPFPIERRITARVDFVQPSSHKSRVAFVNRKMLGIFCFAYLPTFSTSKIFLSIQLPLAFARLFSTNGQERHLSHYIYLPTNSSISICINNRRSQRVTAGIRYSKTINEKRFLVRRVLLGILHQVLLATLPSFTRDNVFASHFKSEGSVEDDIIYTALSSTHKTLALMEFVFFTSSCTPKVRRFPCWTIPTAVRTGISRTRPVRRSFSYSALSIR